MSYRYVVVKRNISVGQEQGEKFCARILHSGTIKPNGIVEEISQNSQVSQPVILAVIKALEIAIGQNVARGVTVELPSLGKFMPILNAKTVDSIEEVDASTIRRLKVKFYPSVPLTDAIQNAKAERANLDIAGLMRKGEDAMEKI